MSLTTKRARRSNHAAGNRARGGRAAALAPAFRPSARRTEHRAHDPGRVLRNCLSKWTVEAARERGLDVDIDSAREKIYGMPYGEWKDKHSGAATPEQLARFEAGREGQSREG